jgi:hypothetical protein
MAHWQRIGDKFEMTKEALTLYSIQIYHVVILVYFKELFHNYVGGTHSDYEEYCLLEYDTT